MRGSSAMKLLAACCGGLLMSTPVDAKKKFYDYRTGEDFGKQKVNCVNAEADKTRYIQVEVFDYNLTPWIKATYTQIGDECGGDNFTPYSATMEYNGNEEGDVTSNRLQMDMYICAPFGEYELEVQVKSTNGGKAMEKVAWEIEYGPDEYHIWDTLNTPFFGTANGATPADFPYAPIPKKYSGSGPGTIYKWPLSGSEGYYSTLYTGPFPPTHCPNLYPSGVAYEGCYPKQSGWTDPTPGPEGTKNDLDPAEPYRLFDGLGSGDDGVDEVGVMTIEKCAGICTDGGYPYMGLQSAVQCVCGNSFSGTKKDNCDLADDNKIEEYKFLCSGDSRVLCGTDSMVSIYSLDGSSPTPTPPTPTPPTPTPPTPTPPTSDEYDFKGCAKDNVDGNRIMPVGPITLSSMSAEICAGICADDGYTYFGTQYGAECFCASTVPSSLDLGHGGCNMACAGNGGEKCGGYNAISVYEIGEAGPTPTPPTPTPPTPTPPSGGDTYEKLGCSVDNVPKKNRVMPVGPISQDQMSADICFGICTDEGYSYFGTQYSVECFCASTVPSNLDLDHGGCNMPCAGNSGETCGGNNAITVYEVGEAGPTPTPPTPTPPTPTPPTPTPPSGGDTFEKLGCSVDNVPKNNRVMPVGPISQDQMSAEICFDICSDDGYSYFGTQYSVECFCASTVPSNLDLDHGGCSMPCAGNSGEICGGNNAITVYEIGEAGPTPTPPTPTPPSGGDSYESIGCFADAQPGPDGKEVRIMGDKTSSNDMKAEVCFELCNDGTNTHFGTQYGVECWCVDDPDLESINQFNDVALPCNFDCAGDSSETCGGNDAMTVYEIN